MKKSLAFISLLLSFVIAFSACGKGENTKPTEVEKGFIKQDHLVLENFNEDFYPVKNKIKQRDGSIDVAIVFDGTEVGWQALADEYMRLHSGGVAVILDTKYTGGTYLEKATQEISDPNTDWDIVQGNVINAQLLKSNTYNMQAAMYGTNPYAGNKVWTESLTEDAYITDKSGANTDCYILNSVSLNTGWFTNSVALEAAGQQGYKNIEGKVEEPLTWDDLISLCDNMQKAGYKYPLGISFDKDSIGTTQFTWLLRIYGDLYYRNEYNGIQTNSDYEVDLTVPNPEGNKNYNLSYNKLLSTILDTESPIGYVGATSEKFKDFLTQFEKIKPYISINASSLSMSDLRNAFQTQANAKESPQILLDFVGSGMLFAQTKNENFEADLFDYPRMVSKFIDPTALVRDVGGNGGYLSIVNHDAAQNQLNLDFIKFVMSPYGQTIYYEALSKTNFAPQGLTTVRNDLVKVPETWKAFFNNDKVTFSGLSDNNQYIGWMIRGHFSDDDAHTMCINYWSRFITGKGNDALTVQNFANNWSNVLSSAWQRVAVVQSWSVDCYKYPDLPDGQSGSQS